MENTKQKVKGVDTGCSYEVYSLDDQWLTEVTDAEKLDDYLKENNMELINYDELAQDL